MRLTTHLHLVLKLRISGAIPPFPHKASWCAIGILNLYILAVLFMKLLL
jgi:hypothetical protein